MVGIKWYNVLSANSQGTRPEKCVRPLRKCLHSLQRVGPLLPHFLSSSPSLAPCFSSSSSHHYPSSSPLALSILCSRKNLFSHLSAKLKWLNHNFKYAFPKDIYALTGINRTFSPKEAFVRPDTICQCYSQMAFLKFHLLHLLLCDLGQRN